MKRVVGFSLFFLGSISQVFAVGDVAEIPDSGIFSMSHCGAQLVRMRYEKVKGGYRVRPTSSGSNRPNPFTRGKVISKTALIRALVSSGFIRPKTVDSSADEPDFDLPVRGIYKLPTQNGLTVWAQYYFDYIGDGFFRIRSLSGNLRTPNPHDRGRVVDQEEMFKTLVAAGVIRNPEPGGPSLNIPQSGTFNQRTAPGSLVLWTSYYYDFLRPGFYRVRSASGAGGPNRFDNGTVMTEQELYEKLVSSGAIIPQKVVSSSDRPTLVSETSGTFRQSFPGVGWVNFHYEYVGNGNFRIRNASLGNANAPNRFDKGEIVTEKDLRARLIAAGAISVQARGDDAEQALSGHSSSGVYTARVDGGIITRADFVYDYVGNGQYRIRNMSGSGRGPNHFDKGTVVSAERMQEILDGAISVR